MRLAGSLEDGRKPIERMRHDGLFVRIANFRALYTAARRAIVGKRKKPGASAFFANLERELLRLERELQEQTYHPGRYVEIEICDPKRRIVSAAPFGESRSKLLT